MEYLELSTDLGAVLDAETGTTALHCILKSKNLQQIFSKNTTTTTMLKKILVMPSVLIFSAPEGERQHL